MDASTREQLLSEIFAELESAGSVELGRFGKLTMRIVHGKLQNLPRGGQVQTQDRLAPKFEISPNYRGYLAMK